MAEKDFSTKDVPLWRCSPRNLYPTVAPASDGAVVRRRVHPHGDPTKIGLLFTQPQQQLGYVIKYYYYNVADLYDMLVCCVTLFVYVVHSKSKWYLVNCCQKPRTYAPKVADARHRTITDRR